MCRYRCCCAHSDFFAPIDFCQDQINAEELTRKIDVEINAGDWCWRWVGAEVRLMRIGAEVGGSMNYEDQLSLFIWGLGQAFFS